MPAVVTPYLVGVHELGGRWCLNHSPILLIRRGSQGHIINSGVEERGVYGSQGSVPPRSHEGLGDSVFASHSGLNVTLNMVSTCPLLVDG